MLTIESYLIALLIQLLATVIGSWLLYQLVFSRCSRGTACLLTGLTAGLLMAPAYPMAEVTTLAPALITAVFNLLFAGGLTEAQPALLSLVVCGLCGAIVGRIYAAIVKRSVATP